ncbi:MAG: hypothetical protein R2855_13975 [Thermomicrobiales bacterium]
MANLTVLPRAGPSLTPSPTTATAPGSFTQRSNARRFLTRKKLGHHLVDTALPRPMTLAVERLSPVIMAMGSIPCWRNRAANCRAFGTDLVSKRNGANGDSLFLFLASYEKNVFVAQSVSVPGTDPKLDEPRRRTDPDARIVEDGACAATGSGRKPCCILNRHTIANRSLDDGKPRDVGKRLDSRRMEQHIVLAPSNAMIEVTTGFPRVSVLARRRQPLAPKRLLRAPHRP